MSILTFLAITICLNLFGLCSAAPASTKLTSSSASQTATAPAAVRTSTAAPPTNADAWWPAVNSTWQIVLNAPIKVPTDASPLTPNADVWDIDMFSNPASTISALHNLGKGVICYFSAGSYEPGRPDSSQFKSADLGNTLDGWPDENWLDIRSTNVRNIMAARIALAKSKGCDAVDPDNVDSYNNDNGLGLTQQDTIDYMNFLASTAAANSISIGLKNAIEVLPQVMPAVQFAVNEQCYGYGECDSYVPLVESGKAVFHIEYPNNPIGKVKGKNLKNICDAGSLPSVPDPAITLSTVLKNTDLSGLVQLCNGTVAKTPTQ